MDIIRIRAEFNNGDHREVAYVCETSEELAALFETLKAQARDRSEYVKGAKLTSLGPKPKKEGE